MLVVILNEAVAVGMDVPLRCRRIVIEPACSLGARALILKVNEVSHGHSISVRLWEEPHKGQRDQITKELVIRLSLSTLDCSNRTAIENALARFPFHMTRI